MTATVLGAKNATAAEILQMATLTAAAPYIGNLTPAADAQRIAQCINGADAMGRATIQ